MNNEDNTKKNVDLMVKLALAYEKRGNKLHPALNRIIRHLKRTDCLHLEQICKHRVKGMCKLTKDGKARFCPNKEIYQRKNLYDSSITPRKQTKVDTVLGLPPKPFISQPSAPPTRRILDDGVFSHTSGRGYSCIYCK